MHERADTAKEILARADDFLQQTCPKYAATAALCSGGYDDPLGGSRPAPGKSRVKTRPATGGRRPLRRAIRPARCPPCPTRVALLELDLGAGAFELLLGLVGVLLGHLLEDGLRGGLDELLRLLEPEAREGPDLLDDLDLLAAGRGEDDVELVLLLGGLCCRRAGGRPGGDRDGRGGGHVELLLERLEELVELEDAHALEDVQQLLGAELGCHGDYSSCSEDSEDSDASVEAAGSEAAR